MDADAIRSYLDAAVSFTQMTRQRAEELVRDMMQAGELNSSQATAWVEEMLDRSRQRSETVLALVRKELDDRIAQLNLVTREDLADLAARLTGAAKMAPAAKKGAKDRKAEEKKAEEKKAEEKKAGEKKPPAKKAGAAKKAAKKAAAASAPAKKAPGAEKAGAAKKAATKKAPAKKAAGHDAAARHDPATDAAATTALPPADPAGGADPKD